MGTFGQRLKELRNDRGISQNELSKHIGVSKSSVNMYERDEREPGFETLEAIADFFNVNMDYLLGRGPKVSTNIGPENIAISVQIDGDQFSDTALPVLIKFVSTLKDLNAPDFNENMTKIFAEMNQTFTQDEREYFLNILTSANDAFDQTKEAVSQDSGPTKNPQFAPAPQEGKDTTPVADGPGTPSEGGETG